MQAVILASGRGTRMGVLTEHTPKPMLRVSGRTLIDHKLDELPEVITEVIIVIGYHGDQIRAQYGDVYKGMRITYVEQPGLDGTGKATWFAQPHITDRFIVLKEMTCMPKQTLKPV